MMLQHNCWRWWSAGCGADYIKKAAPVRGEICLPEMNEIEYCALRENSAVRKLAKVFARVISTLLSSESQRVGLGALSKN